MKIKFFIFINLFSIFILLPILSCSRNDYRHMEGMVWNTLYHITYKGGPELEDSVFLVLDEVGKSLSVFDSTSLVSRVNAGDDVILDNHFIAVYEMSRKINVASHGMFDPTVSPLITAWGFGPGHTATADTAAVDSVMMFVGMGKTHRDGYRLVKDDPRVRFNFSAVAKGYGCDAVAGMFRRNGVKDFMVEIGGELTLGGQSPSGNDWHISIDAPVESLTPTHESFTVIALTDCGIATSGNYRNYRQEGETKVAHTISPVTGRPVFSDVLSATVVAPDCMAADAAATACMAAGSALAETMLDSLGYEGLLILRDSVWTTPGFRRLISAASEPGSKGRN